jgi:hypothetical protein
MKRRVLAAAAVAALSSLALAAPASASLSQCPSTSVCIWANSGYSGSFWSWNSGDVYQLPGHCQNFTTAQNDKASSFDANFWNPDQDHNGGIGVIFWKNIGCSGASDPYNTPATVSNLAGSGFNDTYSSVSLP